MWVDELSGCLGLLINLMEAEAAWRPELRSLPVPGHAGGLVPLLCRLIAATQPASRAAGAPGGGGGLGRRLSSVSGEVTLDALESSGADDKHGAPPAVVAVVSGCVLGRIVASGSS